MNKRFTQFISKSAAIAAAAAIAALPLLVLAQSQNTLGNPLASGNINDIPSFIAAFLKAVVEICLPIITLFFVYSGFLFIKARGNPEAISKARANFLYVVLGAILILGAWILATLIGATVTQVIGNS